MTRAFFVAAVVALLGAGCARPVARPSSSAPPPVAEQPEQRSAKIVRITEPANGATVRRDKPYPGGNPILIKGTTSPNFLVSIYGDEACITRNTMAIGAGQADSVGRFEASLGFVESGRNIVRILALDPAREREYDADACLPAENISDPIEFTFEGSVFVQ